MNDEKPTVYLASGTDRELIILLQVQHNLFFIQLKGIISSPLIILAETCDAHAFFVQWTIMTPIYNASLCIYYVLVVKLGWNERQLHKVRYWFHILPVGISLGTAIAGSILGIYGNATLWCWIVPGSIYRWVFYVSNLPL